jgi:7-cyano-7-deazaguanine synthase in queuosine biosynthesis
MMDPVVRRGLFLCDGASVPPTLSGPEWGTPYRVSTDGSDSEFTLVLDGLARKIAGAVNPRALDLIRIAACCYAADLRVLRSTGSDIHRRHWRRELALVIPVAEPAFWGNERTIEALRETIGFATEDAWTFHFVQAPADTGQLRITWAEQPLATGPTTVVLFSGGSDSLCALVEALRHGERPVVVSHWPARHIQTRQETLLRGVKARFQQWDMPHASFEIHRQGNRRVEASQRTRGLLYACLGAALADHYGIGEVRLADNGYVSINPPTSDQLVGALASRGTHPKFLNLVSGFLALVFPAGVCVTNSLWNRTRAQALRILPEAGCAHLLAHTYSCGKQQGHTKGRPQCGGCSQCVDRRIAVLAAGLDEHDPIGRYELDLFTSALKEGEMRTVPLDFLRFAEETKNLEPRALYARVPQLDDCLIPDDPDFVAKEAGIARVLLDHANETMRVVAAMTALRSDDLVHHRLPSTSLLPLWIGQKSGALADGHNRPAAADTTEDAGARFGLEVVDERSAFLREGETWIVKFRGQLGHFRISRGLTQLTHLLENPGQDLDILALADCRAAPQRAVPTPDGMGVGMGGGLGPMLTPESEKLLKEQHAERTEAINAARAAGRTEQVTKLREELRVIKKLLKDAKGLGGRPRQLGGPEERARKSVSGNVHGCYERMQHTLPRFVEHAKQFIHLGIPPHYRPDPHEDWLIRR